MASLHIHNLDHLYSMCTLCSVVRHFFTFFIATLTFFVYPVMAPTQAPADISNSRAEGQCIKNTGTIKPVCIIFNHLHYHHGSTFLPILCTLLCSLYFHPNATKGHWPSHHLSNLSLVNHKPILHFFIPSTPI